MKKIILKEREWIVWAYISTCMEILISREMIYINIDLKVLRTISTHKFLFLILCQPLFLSNCESNIMPQPKKFINVSVCVNCSICVIKIPCILSLPSCETMGRHFLHVIPCLKWWMVRLTIHVWSEGELATCSCLSGKS